MKKGRTHMIETTLDFLKRLWIDLKRLVFLAIIVIILSSLDGALKLEENYSFLAAVLTSTSIILVIVGISHIIRRVLFPNIDLKEFARVALDNPIAASIVFLGICIILSTFIVVNTMLLS